MPFQPTTSAYATDDGAADPQLAAAIAAYAADPDTEAELLAVLAAARLIVPLVAAPDPDAAEEDHVTDMSLALLQGADGRRALPAFTSLAALAAWDPAARPLPVDAQRAALTSAAEEPRGGVLVVDVAGPVTYTFEGPLLRALAEGADLEPFYADTDVLAAVREHAEADPHLQGATLHGRAGLDAVVRLHAVPDLTEDDLVSVGFRAARRLRESEALRSRTLRGWALEVTPAH